MHSNLDATEQNRQCSAGGVVDRLSGGHSVAARVEVKASLVMNNLASNLKENSRIIWSPLCTGGERPG